MWGKDEHLYSRVDQVERCCQTTQTNLSAFLEKFESRERLAEKEKTFFHEKISEISDSLSHNKEGFDRISVDMNNIKRIIWIAIGIGVTIQFVGVDVFLSALGK